MKKYWVKAGSEWVDLNSEEVEFLNVEEDQFGRDLITFSYKGVEYMSNVIMEYNKP